MKVKLRIFFINFSTKIIFTYAELNLILEKYWNAIIKMKMKIKRKNRNKNAWKMSSVVFK